MDKKANLKVWLVMAVLLLGLVGNASANVKVAVVRSWGSVSVFTELNNNWAAYGTVPLMIDTSLMGASSFTYHDLVNTGADVLWISDPAGMSGQYSAGEIDAVKQYVSEGHSILGTYLVFQYGGIDNRGLAPVFGLREDIVYNTAGLSASQVFDLLVGHPLFHNVPDPYVSSGWPYAQAPANNLRWDASDLGDAQLLAQTDDKRGVITWYQTSSYHAIFISEMVEYHGNPTDTQFLYNALTIPKSKPAVIYVDVDASGANNGTSWADAYEDLQDALSAAVYCDEIWVAGGVYEPDESFRYPNGTGSRNATFQLKNGVVIKGGYAGFGEPDPDARDFELYETILSGDLYGDDGPDFANNGENSYHVVTGNGTNATAVLDGFTITAGNAGFGGGGGMFSYEGSPTLTNCTFSSNSADVGGGMLSWNNSSPTLTNCTFSGNSSGWAGGGMANWESSNPTLTNCTFSSNWAEGEGGGMANWNYSSPTLTNCTFSDNSAGWSGGGMNNHQSSPTLTDCTFSGNSAEHGGGMNNGEYSNLTVTNCIFNNNSAGESGGGMNNWRYSSPTVTDCTFSGNSANVGGGMVNGEYCSPTLTDCIFSGNSAGEHGGGVFNHESSATVTNCTFIGNSVGEAGGGLNNSVNSNSTVTNCIFTGNSARHGGGMLNHESSPTLTNCTFSGNSAGESGSGLNNSSHSSPTVTNCTFSDNSAGDVGGGMNNWYESNPTVTNCTFSRNSVRWNGGGMCNWDNSRPTVSNCILWGNTASSGSQIYNGWGCSTTVSYSDVQGSWPGAGNKNADPCFVGPTYGGPIEGLIAHWKFDEGGGTVAYDSSAGENHGTVYGAQWTTGKAGGALSFDGINDYVDVGNLGLSSEFTVMGWMYYYVSVMDEPIFGSDSPGEGRRISLRSNAFEVTPNGVGWNDRNHVEFQPISTGIWHHLVGVYNGSQIEVFIDGISMGTHSAGSGALDPNPNNYIGRHAAGHNWYMDGLIDDVRIYNRALSAEEIQQFYQMDYHLLPGSPCIDAGDNTAVPAGVTTDLGGNPRFVDDPYTVDTGNGTPPIVDMGAYEYRLPISIYVDEDAPGPIHDGLGWADAFNHLQDALAVAMSGDEIRVAEGTYMPDSNSDEPDGTRDREATFQLINGVGLYGGYAGYGEPDPNERDVELYETVLSGDLNGNDGPNFANNGENSYHIVTGSWTNATALLDGFTITAGNANGGYWPDDTGGGMYNEDGSPTLTNCTFSGNSAGWSGGGMGNSVNSNSTVTNCTFSGNRAEHGGGMANESDCSPTLTNCTFSENSTGTWGGGMHNYSNSSPALTNCTFSDNLAGRGGGGMTNEQYCSPTLTNCIFSGNSANGDGGAMYNRSSSPKLTNCTFSGNSAYHGGGMGNRSHSSPTLTNCTFSANSAGEDGGGMWNNWNSNPTLTNCTFSGNTAYESAGGMWNYNYSSPMLTNCTFSGNSAYYGGGMSTNEGSNPTLTSCTFSGNSARWGGGMWNRSSPTVSNCILWGNTAPSGPQIHNDGTSSATVSYSCVQGYVEPTEPPIQGLIAHWRFDEGDGDIAYDSFGDNHGTLINGPEWTSGQIGDALSFDGYNDYVDVSDDASLDISEEITIALWLFQRSQSTHGGCGVTKGYAYKFGPESTPKYILRMETTGGSWFNQVLKSNSATMLNEWTHIAATYDSTTSTSRIYINGTLDVESTTAITGTMQANDAELWIGRGASPYFDGAIDDVRIYDRALSAEEVEQLYQYGLNQGNIDADPRFLDPADGDLRLLPTSPCIDAGDNTAVPAGVTTDLGGNLRFVDQTEVPDTGNGTAPIVDMGAFEADYIQAQMKFTPKVLNPKSKAKWIKAHLVLPEGFVVEDVNTNSPAKIVEPFIADSNYMEVFLNEDGLVEILAAFDRADFCSNGSTQGDIVVIAQLTTGQYFYGTDTIRILVNNLEYLAVLTSHWLEAGCGKPDWCSGADLDEDTVVNFVDFALFDGCCIEVIKE